MLSVIIPSRTDAYLKKTVDDLLANAFGKIEIIIVLDGYRTKKVRNRSNVLVIQTDRIGMRACINAGMNMAQGKYVMKLDEHCMVAPSFDASLAIDCAEDWVVVPRRYRLDAEAWKVIQDGRPPIDYMYNSIKDGTLRGRIWNSRAEQRQYILIDDTMTFQGSCYFMHRDYWMRLLHPLDDDHYGPFANEAQEISNKVWLSGGRVIVNKQTWYAHWHRHSEARNGNSYHFTNAEQVQFNRDLARGRAHCLDYWLNNRWEGRIHDYRWLADKFGAES